MIVVFLLAGAVFPVMAEETITLGFSGPLSGGGAQFGQNLKWGLEMAAEDINAMGGVSVNGEKYSVRVVGMDDQFQTAMTVNNAKRLRYKEGARFILNPSTGGIFGLMEVNTKEGFIIGAHTTTHEVVTQGNPLIFRVPAPMMGYVKAGADTAMEQGWKRCAMMPGAYDYGKIWSSLFQGYWESKGGEIVSNTPVDFMRVTDYYPLLTKAIASKPDVILLGSSSEPDAMQIQQARELGYKGGFIIIERGKLIEMEEYLGGLEPLNHCIGTAPAAMYPGDAIKELGKRFKAKYGEDRAYTHETSLAYTNALIYLAGIELAQTTEDVNAIMAAILDDEKMAGVDWFNEMAVYEPMGIYENGAVRADLWTTMVKDGQYKLFHQDIPRDYYLKSYSK
jgi:branched-chain amino acid transport system substrate-binding protein